jgi:methionyl-tRNA formyltransferase
MGPPDFAVPSLRALVDTGANVVAVVTQPDRPKGRSPEPQPPPVKVLATSLGIPVYQPKSIRKGEFPDKFRELAPDLAVVVAFGRIIPEDMLAVPRLGFVNVHASLLPRFRGAAPIQRAIMEGEDLTGVTIMQLDAGLDTGDILFQLPCPIEHGATAGDLHDTLSVLGAKALLLTLPTIEAGTVEPVRQDDSLATLAPILQKEDGRVDFSLPARRVFDHVRGVHPWPGAFTSFRGRGLKIHPPLDYRDGEPGGAPGAIVRLGEDAIEVACGSGVLLLTAVQPENKRRMTAAEFRNGYRLEIGERLGDEGALVPEGGTR